MEKDEQAIINVRAKPSNKQNNNLYVETLTIWPLLPDLQRLQG